MTEAEIRRRLEDYFRALELWHYTRNYFPLPFTVPDRQVPETAVQGLVSSVIERASGLEIDQEKLQEKIAERITGLSQRTSESWRDLAKKADQRRISNRKTPWIDNSLDKFLYQQLSRIQDKVKAIPNSIEKAYLALEAMVACEHSRTDSDQLLDAIIAVQDGIDLQPILNSIVSQWREEQNHFRNHPHTFTDIFWVSRNHHEIVDGVSRYRFRERFDIAGFDAAFASFEGEIGDFLAQNGSHIRWLCHELWVASRSRRLMNRIQDSVNRALKHILDAQGQPSWDEVSEIKKKWIKKPSVATTTYAALCVLKLSESETARRRATEAVHWLLEMQNTDGSWATDYAAAGKLVVRPDLMVTVAAIEAIARSGVSGATHHLSIAQRWILSQQDEIGMWRDTAFPFPLATVFVLDALRFVKTGRIHNQDVYLSASQGFLKRSALLSREDSAASRRLALIAAYQGVEAFLYSILQDKNVTSIWSRNDKNQTIGMIDALTALQELLKKHKHLTPDAIIKYRNSIERLAHMRDEVVHKAAFVSPEECQPLVDTASNFASYHSRLVFGFDFLE